MGAAAPAGLTIAAHPRATPLSPSRRRTTLRLRPVVRPQPHCRRRAPTRL
ncbi:hypothetical protein ACFPM0_06540 [Pseudonocardia sulfidoxydans]